MILYLDTSTPTCHLWLDDTPFEYQTDRNLARDLLGLILESIKEAAHSERSLNVTSFGSVSKRGGSHSVRAKTGDPERAVSGGNREGDPIEDLSEMGRETVDRTRNTPTTSQFLPLTAIAVFRGPGSFTGLRIGATVANTLADQLSIPIVSAAGKNWRQLAQQRLSKGENDQIALPEYGKPANITTPRK